jgi:hypothetical protein
MGRKEREAQFGIRFKTTAFGARTPSPRLRGEGGVRGTLDRNNVRRRFKGGPQCAESPPHPTSLRLVDLSPQAGRGEPQRTPRIYSSLIKA